MEDWQLLEDYARTGSEAAFAQLVDRYLGLVHTAARRQLQDDALAADVAQAVFLLLARKAGSFGRQVVLSGWLFRTTRFVAARAQRTEIRRQRREQEALAMQELNTPNSHWNCLSPDIDEAIAGLSEPDRNALLLRFAEGRNHREVGIALGLNEEAAKKRVNRALDKLRVVLGARSVPITVAVLAAMLSDRLVAAPPVGLAATLTRGVVSGGAEVGVAAGLAQQVTASWRWTQIQLAAAFVAAVSLVSILLISWNGPEKAAVSLSGMAAVSTSANSPIVFSSRPTAAEQTFRLEVVTAETGEPLPNVRVPLNFVINDQWLSPDDLVTDEQGVCTIQLPRGTLARLDAGAHLPGYENRFFTWRSDWQHPLPDGYTLRLGRAESVGGQVLNEQRQPLAGVSVWLAYHISDTSWREPDQDRERLGFMRRILLGATDPQGRWSCNTIPPTRERFAFEFEHPDYVKEDSLSVSRDDDSAVGREVLANLRSRKAVTTLRAGLVAFGRVVDTTGDPVAGARIASAWHEEGVLTDADGQFTVRRLPPGDVLFVATALGFAPKPFNAVGGGKAIRVQLETGGVLRARILTTNSEPIAGATLLLDEGFGSGALGWDDKSDADGWVTWQSAPRNETRTFTAHAPGYRMVRQITLRTDGSEQTISLIPTLTVVGNVVDERTGEPVGRFKAIPGEGYDSPNFDRSNLHYGTNGVYQLTFSEAGAMAIRIEAEGYATDIGRPNPGPNGEPRCDFKLRREDPNSGIRGVVLNPDGSPSAGAAVVLCSLEHGAVLTRGTFRQDDRSIFTNADGAGRFVFPPVRVPHTVVAVSAEGLGRVRARGGSTLEVRLEPFGTIEGIVSRNDQPLVGQTVILVDPSFAYFSGAVSLDSQTFQARSDAEGRFRIEGVPASELRLYLSRGVGTPFTDETRVKVSSGRTASVVIGEPDSAGRLVIGRLRASELGLVTDWRRHLISHSLSRKVKTVTPPAGLSDEAGKLWLVNWHQSEDGIALNRQSCNYDVVVDAEGTFTVRGVPAGEYQLSIEALPADRVRKDPWAQQGSEWRGYAIQTVLIPDANPAGGDLPLDLGDVEMTIQRRRRN